MCDLPIVAQMTIQTDGNTVFGATPEVFTQKLEEWGADVIGLNCGVGPTLVLTALEKMRAVTKKKLSAQPNAGLPRDVQGRQFYMCSPEYMSKFAKRFIQVGASLSAAAAARRRAHQTDRRRHPRHQPAQTGFRRQRAARDSNHRFKTGDVKSCRSPNSARTGAKNRPRRIRHVGRSSAAERLRRGKNAGIDPFLKEAGVDAVNVPDGPRAQTRMSAQATSRFGRARRSASKPFCITAAATAICSE
jgi:hypothetical protein